MTLATLARQVRPLSALAHKSARLAAGPLRLVVGALILATLPLVAASPLARGADPPPAEPEGAPSAAASFAVPDPGPAPEFKPPELLYLAWSVQPKDKFNPPPPEVIWDRRGKLLDRQARDELLKQAGRLSTSGWTTDQLNTLVLVFGVDGSLDYCPVSVSPVGPSAFGSGVFSVPAHGLVSSHVAISASKEFPRWPERISLGLRWPVEKPQVVLKLDEVPAASVQLAAGVTWLIDPPHPRGPVFPPIRRNGAWEVTAAVLQRWQEPAEQALQTDWYAHAFLADGIELPTDEVHAYPTGEGQVTRFEITPLRQGAKIARLRFERQRFRHALIEDVPLRTRDLPEDEQ
jgi:hypothetical protein